MLERVGNVFGSLIGELIKAITVSVSKIVLVSN